MESLLTTAYHQLIQSLKIKTHRFFYPSFNLKNRLTGIVGPRGSGKTTLILQYIKEHLYANNNAFYFTADHIYFNQTTMLEFVSKLFNEQDIHYFFIDEMHKYKNWSQELKNIYDSFPTVYIIFSGSSSLDLVNGTYDLSRRAKLYHLPGLSFREYLYLQTGIQVDAIDLNKLFSDPRVLDIQLSQIPKILGHFRKYLQRGYYPFLLEDEDSYDEKVLRIIEKTIYEDIAEYYNLKTENLHYLKKITGFLASIAPGQINTHNIAKNLGIDFKTANNYLTMLSETNLARMLYSKHGGNDILRKPEKVFLNNTSLLYTLDKMRGIEPPIGNVRELFLLQSVSDAKYQAFYSEIGDMLVEGNYLEIGGKNKSMNQFNKMNVKGFLVKDDVTASAPNIIPLHYFGFLY